MKTARFVVVALALLVSALAALGQQGAQATGDGESPAPSIGVWPSAGLRGGDTVRVWATGLPPETQLRVVQCDTFGNPDEECRDLVTPWTTARGTLRVDVTLVDPVFVMAPFGDDRPAYCRADACRIGLLTMRDENDETVLLAQSRALEFTGSPARVRAVPSQGLRPRQWVRVEGTARGAGGRRVRIAQASCYDLVQGRGCYAEGPVRWTRVRANGRFGVGYVARRFLHEGETAVDCNDWQNNLGACVMTATVYGKDGQPDRSFGVPGFGPHAPILFVGDPRL